MQQLFSSQVYRKYGKEYGERTNPNISYRFYVPAGHRDMTPQGRWAVATAACSVSCGSGLSLSTMTATVKTHRQGLVAGFGVNAKWPLSAVRIELVCGTLGHLSYCDEGF